MLTLASAALLSRPCSSKLAASFYAAIGTGQYGANTPKALRRSFHSSLPSGKNKSAQPQTSATENIELTAPKAYISESYDPWYNLSYEDWLLRNTPKDQPVLFLYRNRPCVVLGRNQNPWQESTPHQLAEWDIPLIRRRSGGGTVFHDMGNTNFSIILPRLLFTRSHGAELVSRAIRERLGIKQCTVNDRNDVIIRDGAKDLKVSGSAYKIIQHRAYHHGTMLISSSLADLGKSLRSRSPNIQGKSVASFRSPVTTLNTYLPSCRSSSHLTHEDFTQAVIAEFGSVYGKDSEGVVEVTFIKEEDTKTGHEKIRKGVEELKSWEWTYGQTPEFENRFEGDLSFGQVSAQLTARHALIQSITLRTDNPKMQEILDDLSQSLVGQRYATLDDIETGSNTSPVQDEVITWLQSSM